jgi:hypothetical protein
MYYQSRLLTPLSLVLSNVHTIIRNRHPLTMKYLIHSLHDLNIAQALNFLGYYSSPEAYKTSQPIDFLASIRFEVI